MPEGACRLYPSHGPLRFITSHSFRACLCHAKNEAPEEEAVALIYYTQDFKVYERTRDQPMSGHFPAPLIF